MSGDPHVKDTFVGGFCEATKTVAFISAHAHGYERFKGCGEKEKAFFISAGGGGPRPAGGLSDDTDVVDEFTHEDEKRPFNWLTIDTNVESNDGFEIVVNSLYEGEPLEVVFLAFAE